MFIVYFSLRSWGNFAAATTNRCRRVSIQKEAQLNVLTFCIYLYEFFDFHSNVWLYFICNFSQWLLDFSLQSLFSHSSPIHLFIISFNTRFHISSLLCSAVQTIEIFGYIAATIFSLKFFILCKPNTPQLEMVSENFRLLALRTHNVAWLCFNMLSQPEGKDTLLSR